MKFLLRLVPTAAVAVITILLAPFITTSDAAVVRLDSETPDQKVYKFPSNRDRIHVVSGFLFPGVNIFFKDFECKELRFAGVYFYPGSSITIDNVEAHSHIFFTQGTGEGKPCKEGSDPPPFPPGGLESWTALSKRNIIAISILNCKVHGVGPTFLPAPIEFDAAIWISEIFVCGVRITGPDAKKLKYSASAGTTLDLTVRDTTIDFESFSSRLLNHSTYGLLVYPLVNEVNSSLDYEMWARLREVTIEGSSVVWPEARLGAAEADRHNIILSGVLLGHYSATDQFYYDTFGFHDIFRFLGQGSADVVAITEAMTEVEQMAKLLAGASSGGSLSLRSAKSFFVARGNTISLSGMNVECGGIRFGAFGGTQAVEMQIMGYSTVADNIRTQLSTVGQPGAFDTFSDAMIPTLRVDVSGNTISVAGVGYTQGILLCPVAVAFNSSVLVAANIINVARKDTANSENSLHASLFGIALLTHLMPKNSEVLNISFVSNSIDAKFNAPDERGSYVRTVYGILFTVDASAPGVSINAHVANTRYSSVRYVPPSSQRPADNLPSHYMTFVRFARPRAALGRVGQVSIDNFTLEDTLSKEIATGGTFDTIYMDGMRFRGHLRMLRNKFESIVALEELRFAGVRYGDIFGGWIVVNTTIVRARSGKIRFLDTRRSEMEGSAGFISEFFVSGNQILDFITETYNKGVTSMCSFVSANFYTIPRVRIIGNIWRISSCEECETIGSQGPTEHFEISNNEISLVDGIGWAMLFIGNANKKDSYMKIKMLAIRNNVVKGFCTGVPLVQLSNAWGSTSLQTAGMKRSNVHVLFEGNIISVYAKLNPKYVFKTEVPGLVVAPKEAVLTAVFNLMSIEVPEIVIRNNLFFNRRIDKSDGSPASDMVFFGGGSRVLQFRTDAPCSRYYSGPSKTSPFVTLTPAKVDWFTKQLLPPNKPPTQLIPMVIARFGANEFLNVTGDCAQSLSVTESIVETPSATRTVPVSGNTDNGTQTEELEPTQTAPFFPEPEITGSLKAAATTAQALAAAAALFVGPGVAIDGGRALSILTTVKRCDRYQQSEAYLKDEHRKHNDKAREEMGADKFEKSGAATQSLKVLSLGIVHLKEQFARNFIRRPLPFPESTLPSVTIGDGDLNTLRGAVFGGFLVLLIVSCLALLLGALLSYRERAKQWKEYVKRVEGGESSSERKLREKKEETLQQHPNPFEGEAVMYSSVGKVKKPKFLRLVCSRKNVVQHSRLPFILTMAVAILMSSWFPSCCVFFIADGLDGRDRFFYGILPVIFIWLFPAMCFCSYLQHAALSRAYERPDGGADGGRFLPWVKKPMPRPDGFQLEKLQLWFPRLREMELEVDLCRLEETSGVKMRIMECVEGIFGKEGGIARRMCFGDFVWSEGSTRVSQALGPVRSFLRQCGGILNKHMGPYSGAALREIVAEEKRKKFFAGGAGAGGADNNANDDDADDENAFLRPDNEAEEALSRGITNKMQPLRTLVTPYWTYISSIWAASAALAQTVSALHPGRCGDVMTVMNLNCAAALLTSCLLRPFIVPARNVAQILSDLCVLVGCVVATVALQFTEVDVEALKSGQEAQSASAQAQLIEAVTILLLGGVGVAIVGSAGQGFGKVLMRLRVVQQATPAEFQQLSEQWKKQQEERERKLTMTAFSAEKRERQNQRQQQQRGRSFSSSSSSSNTRNRNNSSSNSSRRHHLSRLGENDDDADADGADDAEEMVPLGRHQRATNDHRRFNFSPRDFSSSTRPNRSEPQLLASPLLEAIGSARAPSRQQQQQQQQDKSNGSRSKASSGGTSNDTTRRVAAAVGSFSSSSLTPPLLQRQQSASPTTHARERGWSGLSSNSSGGGGAAANFSFTSVDSNGSRGGTRRAASSSFANVAPHLLTPRPTPKRANNNIRNFEEI